MCHGQPPSGFGQRRRMSVSRSVAATHRTLKTVYRNIRTQNGVLPFGAVLPGETPTTPVCMNPSKTFVSSAQPAAVPGCRIVHMRRPRSAAGKRSPNQSVSPAHCLHPDRASGSRTLRCLWKCPAPLQSGHSSSRQRAFFRSASFLHVSSFFPPHWDGAKPLISFGKLRPRLNEKPQKKDNLTFSGFRASNPYGGESREQEGYRKNTAQGSGNAGYVADAGRNACRHQPGSVPAPGIRHSRL